MKTLLLILTMVYCMTSFGQLTPKLTGKPQPVTPNIRYYQPTDLTVPYFAVRSVTYDPNRSSYFVTVNVTVRNAGELPSNSLTVLKCFFSGAAGTVKAPARLPPAANDPNHGNIGPWTYCAEEPKLPIVKGGMSWGGDLTFEVLANDVHGKFYLIMLADFYNNSKESNENNNYSTPILVTPPNH